MASIAILGCGRVGLVSAVCFAELGHEVSCFDNNPAVVRAFREGRFAIRENHLSDLFARHRRTRLHFVTDLAAAVERSETIFVAVGTPQREGGDADISQVEEVARMLGPLLKTRKLIVEKSTVPVLTHRWIERILQLNGARPDCIEVASNPEFVREGSAITDWLYPERIVLGTVSESAAKRLRELYSPLENGTYRTQLDAVPPPPGAPLRPRMIVTDPSSAELIKYASNSFLAAKISFIDAVANLCDSVGADIDEVCEGVGTDARIGQQFLRPGIGFGGSGFAKDLTAFGHMLAEFGQHAGFFEEVERINRDQRSMFLGKIRKALWTIRGKKLAILGLAYKGGTDDIRDSAAIEIAHQLAQEGAYLKAYDPAAMDDAAKVLTDEKVTFARSAYEAAEGCEAVIVLTDWPEFRALDLDMLCQSLSYPIVIDGRNLFDPEEMVRHGLMYCSIGRPDAVPNRRRFTAAPQ
ncbi:MAG: UDP-glucose dehydrogenase family protein [Terriglobales bacterium]